MIDTFTPLGVGSEYSCSRSGCCAGHLRVMGKADKSLMKILVVCAERSAASCSRGAANITRACAPCWPPVLGRQRAAHQPDTAVLARLQAAVDHGDAARAIHGDLLHQKALAASVEPARGVDAAGHDFGPRE